MKGATDTSNFDDYPDSDQEPPAVNASGPLENAQLPCCPGVLDGGNDWVPIVGRLSITRNG